MNYTQRQKRSRTWAIKDYSAGVIERRIYQLLLAGVAFYWNRHSILIAPKGGIAWEHIELKEGTE